MEHPIPQNVTSFQFKLVGDMTLKQFIYLCTGVSIAYLAFVFLLPRSAILAWPIILIATLLGVAFAFLPIADRPLDHWLGAFLQAIYSPTQRVWKKQQKPYTEYPYFKKRFTIYLSQLPQVLLPVNAIPTQQVMPITQTQTVAAPSQATINMQSQPQQQLSSPPIEQKTAPLPTEEELAKTVDLARQAQSLQLEIIETEKQLEEFKRSVPQAGASSEVYTQQINSVLDQIQKLVNEASEIKGKLAQTVHQPETSPTKVKVSIVTPPKPKASQVTLTTFPNVINGVIVDLQNNYLPGVVVVIYDKQGLPVRALKTNKLGQFSGSTPLPNGIYTVQMEKDDFVFDVIQIELEGSILPPILITGKTIQQQGAHL